MKNSKLFLGMSLISLSLASCGTTSATTTSATGTSTAGTSTAPTSTVATSTAPTSTTGTKKTVNVYMPSPAGLQTKLETGFEAAYSDIDMVVTSGTTGELLAKIEAEKENPVCDVLILASWSDGINSLSSLDLMAYTPVGSDKLYSEFTDSSNKIWGTSASAVGVLYNTDLVDKSKIEQLDWEDFADSSKVNACLINEGTANLSIPDPTKSGACKDFLAGFVSSKGETAANSVFQGWANNGLKNGGGNKNALADVESGAVDILVAGVDYNAYSDKKKGKSIDIYYPKGGTVVNARPAMIMNSATHVDEAKKVMDYLCTTEAQNYVSDAYLLPGRTDVNANSARLGYNDINKLPNINWTDMAANGTEIATNFVSLLASK